MMTSQILKSVNFTKTQKSIYLKNETFFLQIKKIIVCTSRVSLRQKSSFVAKVTCEYLTSQNTIIENLRLQNRTPRPLRSQALLSQGKS